MKLIPAVIMAVFLAAVPALADISAYEPVTPGVAGAAGRRTPIVVAIEKARPAVVSIYAQVQQSRGGGPFSRDPFHDEFFNRFFQDHWSRRSRTDVTLGSGVIIDGARGIIATNEHVIRGAVSITVTLGDGRELPASVLGSDPRFDLAVLSVESKSPLPELKLGDSDHLMIGETVIAIGNPFGLSHTATTGVVSATGRTMPGEAGNEPLRDLIQTDASINPGNSGGPLVDINGEVVGINTAIMARGEGLGFAIPSSQIKRITASLLRGDRGGAGMDMGLELAESGRPVKGETGLLVVEAKSGGPADRAGLKKGDLLMKLDGSPTSTVAEYDMILSSLSPGQSYAAEITRDNRAMTLNISPRILSEQEALDLAFRLYGLKVREERGYLVLESPAAGSSAESVGLRAGDVLLAFGSAELAVKSDLAKAVLSERAKPSVNIAIQRGRMIYRTTIQRLGR
ncbi:peptidase [Deltaproteobacteria bacterium Smac51]|nr:peptidase [Deltaproteobacteria bacterium Smac51]